MASIMENSGEKGSVSLGDRGTGVDQRDCKVGDCESRARVVDIDVDTGVDGEDLSS